MQKLSVVISAWNEEAKLARTLASVKWANELIVIDNASTDKTAGIARSHGAKVLVRPNVPMLNTNKNFGFTKAAGPWILNLDADEEVPLELAREIKEILRNDPSENGFWIARKNIIFGKWISHGLWWPDRQLRLFRKGKGAFPCKHVHEYLAVDGMTGNLTHPFVHHNYETVSQFLRKMDSIYTESEVVNLRAARYSLTWRDAIRFPVSDFVKIYFAQEGYKDGLHGLVISLLQSFYSLVVFAKLWEKEGFKDQDPSLTEVSRELERSGAETTYWVLTGKIRALKNPLLALMLQVKRKIVAARLKTRV